MKKLNLLTMADFSFPRTSLDDFQTVYVQEFGESLDEDELERKARFLLNLYRIIYRSPVEAIQQDESNHAIA